MNEQTLILMNAVDGARYVYFDEDMETLYLWFGGCMVNIWMQTVAGWKEVDCFTLGDVPDVSEVQGHINEWIDYQLDSCDDDF